jgi:alkanesulfonate monooxygenase SsuD/methylene tetrahydromethanopterin reductase-like flavin-dependent oxidoreductase (luciferase family)
VRATPSCRAGAAHEYVVAGTPWEKRGKRFEEALTALKTIWTTDPVEFEGDFYSIPRSFIGPKPVQKPHPPIYLGAFSPKAAARVVRHADGWLAGLPIRSRRSPRCSRPSRRWPKKVGVIRPSSSCSYVRTSS